MESTSLNTEELIKKIAEVESVSRTLEPSAEERKFIRDRVTDYLDSFIDSLPAGKAYEASDKGNPFADMNFSEEGIPFDETLNIVREHVDEVGINPASGNHLGYIPGGGIFYSSIGDYWADITNRYAGIFFANPGAVRMENQLIRWMTDLVGYPRTAAGNIASGGSIANLTAIVVARDATKIMSADIPQIVIYATHQVHHCVGKALKVAGLAEAKVVYVEMDDHYRMKTDVLEEKIEKDREAGLRPWMVIASAGTTDTGAVDPLEEIGEVCEKNDLWYHIDAAYGGFYMLSNYGRELMKGIEMSDSVVMDPHKTMFLPYGSGVCLVKDGNAMKDSLRYYANYMQDATEDPNEINPADVSPELTKHYRGLRMWLPMMIHGLKPFRAALEEKRLLALYFHQKVEELGFETGPEPQLSVSTFRYVPPEGDANEFNQRLLEEIHKDGRIFISSTTIEDQFILRAAIVVFRTHKETIDLFLGLLKEKVHKLLSA